MIWLRCFITLIFIPCAVQAQDRLPLDYTLYAQGKYVFERNCVICHGPRGDGEGEMSKGLNPKPRSFREGMFKFRTTPYGALPAIDDLRATIRTGLTGTAMGMFTQLSDEDITSVIEYVKSFSRRWRKPENYAEPLTFPTTPEWFKDESSKKQHAVTGQVLFTNVCSTCHGPKADGNGPTAPTLKDIWNMPAKPSDLRQPHLRCGDDPSDVYRILTTGMNGTPMISYEGALSPEQRWDIIAYISTIKVPDVPNLGPAPKVKKP